MRFVLFASMLALAACAPRPPLVGMPYDEMRTDSGTIVGSWREVRRNGYALSISTFLSFAVQKGCSATGGMLRPLGGNRFRIERYESGFAAAGCGPWRAGPELAPFDGSEVVLTRSGDVLVAEGGGRRVELRRMVLRGAGV